MNFLIIFGIALQLIFAAQVNQDQAYWASTLRPLLIDFLKNPASQTVEHVLLMKEKGMDLSKTLSELIINRRPYLDKEKRLQLTKLVLDGGADLREALIKYVDLYKMGMTGHRYYYEAIGQILGEWGEYIKKDHQCSRPRTLYSLLETFKEDAENYQNALALISKVEPCQPTASEVAKYVVPGLRSFSETPNSARNRLWVQFLSDPALQTVQELKELENFGINLQDKLKDVILEKEMEVGKRQKITGLLVQAGADSKKALRDIVESRMSK